MLLALAPTPVVRLNRAIVLAKVESLRAALDELDALSADLKGYHIFHAVRGELLADLNRLEEAAAARRDTKEVHEVAATAP